MTVSLDREYAALLAEVGVICTNPPKGGLVKNRV